VLGPEGVFVDRYFQCFSQAIDHGIHRLIDMRKPAQLEGLLAAVFWPDV
jgi:hypothetical protein